MAINHAQKSSENVIPLIIVLNLTVHRHSDGEITREQ